jgi:hypothetical protein
MDGRRLTGPRACGSLFEKSKLGGFAFRQLGNGGAQFIRRAFENGGEGIGHRGRAEARAQVLHSRRTHLRHRDLGVDVAGDQRRLSAVGEDDAFDIGLRDAGVHDLDGWEKEALLEHLGGVGGGRTSDRAAHVRLVRYRARERDKLAAGENRRDERHVGNVRQSAGIGMIGNEYVAVLDSGIFRAAAIEIENAADQMPVDRGVEEHRRRHDQPPAAIEDHAAEIARLANDGRIAGTIEMVVHLIDQACNLVAQDLDGDGIHVHALARIRLP